MRASISRRHRRRKIASVGLIGFGYSGRHLHLPLIRAAGMQIGAVVTRRAAEVAQALPGAEVLASADQLLARPQIDLVVIASASGLHADQARAALRAGKHVMVEKPLALTSAEAGELCELADRRQCKLAVFHNRRWDSDFLTVRRLLAEGALGEILTFNANWDRYRPVVKDRWRENGAPGGGVLYDLGSHLIDQTLMLFGKPDWIQADVYRQRPQALADDAFQIDMAKGPLRIRLGALSMAAAPGWRFEIHGSRGSFRKGALDPQEEQLIAGMRPEDPQFGVEPQSRWGHLTLGADSESMPVPSERGQWAEIYAQMFRSISSTSASVPVGAHDAQGSLEIIEACRQSALTGCRVVP